MLYRQYPRVPPRDVRLVLVEATDRLLSQLAGDMGQRAMESLRRRGVDVRTRTRAVALPEGGIVIQSDDRQEFLPARTIVWAAGVRPVPAIARLPLPHDRIGRLIVDPYLQVVGQPGVYAIGDGAAFTDERTGRILPPNAAVAVQQGEALARIIAARLAGDPPTPFRYRHRGELISLGRYDALADIYGIRLDGLPAWLLWRAFYLSTLMGAKNRLGVALDWSFAYFYRRDTAEMQCLPEHEPEPILPAEGLPAVEHRAAADD